MLPGAAEAKIARSPLQGSIKWRRYGYRIPMMRAAGPWSSQLLPSGTCDLEHHGRGREAWGGPTLSKPSLRQPPNHTGSSFSGLCRTCALVQRQAVSDANRAHCQSKTCKSTGTGYIFWGKGNRTNGASLSMTDKMTVTPVPQSPRLLTTPARDSSSQRVAAGLTP